MRPFVATTVRSSYRGYPHCGSPVRVEKHGVACRGATSHALGPASLGLRQSHAHRARAAFQEYLARDIKAG